ncbi:hypothetical protein [Halomonas heilongjiangensis]|uniref:Uncharacterized protein n=1 Tax=Halomonas heilongjiangensis TaxID=1387883 RepID=A0A2N7THP2_9GAMM|nr:hypothetical protein [Halomonas heilongjiangensis]PMR67712.1 hypothetical protein C1H66_18370 [Halomonas heilongjiangensis]PXX87587.1 hypothetical protein CR158_17415 [Halomonas heilongjiangensis]
MNSARRTRGMAWWPVCGWRRWAASLLAVMALMLLLDHGHRLLQGRAEAPLFRVVVNGESLLLDAETHAEFGRDLDRLTARWQENVVASMQPWVDERLEAAFAPLEAAVPGYLDWYYSLAGSYLRLGMAVAGELDDWLDAQLHERLVAASGVEEALAELEADYPQQLARMQQERMQGVVQRLHEAYEPRQATPAAEGERPVQALDLDLALGQALHDGLDVSRWGTATLGGAGVGLVAGRALAQRLGAGAAVQGSRVVVRGLVARLGVNTARSLATGGMAAAAASPSGPGAMVIGTATTAIALAGFVGSEYALLKAQEALHRPAMQAQLLDEIDQARQETGRALDDLTVASVATLAARATHHAGRAEAGAQAPEAYRIFGTRGD